MKRDPIGYGDSPNLSQFAGSSPSSRADPTGLCQVETCGPVVDNWFLFEVVLFSAAASKIRPDLPVLTHGGPDGMPTGGEQAAANVVMMRAFADLALKMDYKARDFISPNSSCGDCSKSVTLCNTCIPTNQLGNIMFGIIAEQLGLTDNARRYGRGDLRFGRDGPSSNWRDSPKKELAFNVGVCIHQKLFSNSLLHQPGVVTRIPPWRFCQTMFDCLTTENAWFIHNGCTPCNVQWNGPHTNFDEKPLVDDSGNVLE